MGEAMLQGSRAGRPFAGGECGYAGEVVVGVRERRVAIGGGGGEQDRSTRVNGALERANKQGEGGRERRSKSGGQRAADSGQDTGTMT